MHGALHAVHHGAACAGNHHPHLIAVHVAVVIHAVAGVQRHLDGQAFVLHIQYAEAAPGFFGKHDLLVDLIHIGLDVAGLLFIRYQNSLRAGRDHHIMQAHGQHRHVQLVHHMHVGAGIVHHGLAHAGLAHRFSQGVPGAKVLPLACKPHNLDLGFLFHHSIVKADFVQLSIFIKQILIIGKVDQLMGLIQHIAQLVGKHAAVPQRPLGDVSLCRFGVRLFLKGCNIAHGAAVFGDNIAVFFAGVGRLNAHQHQVGFAFGSLLTQGFQCLKVVILHIGVHRADHHRLLRVHALHIGQIGRCQRNGGEGIAAARFHRNAHFLPQLVVDGGNLGLAGGNGHSCPFVYLFDLAVHPLHHGFIASVRALENFNELLGTDIVG